MINVDIEKLVNNDWYTNESYKSIRANIQFCGANIKVIMLTSATENEGKSTVALNLAAAFADEGNRVLFVDADLRKSVLVSRLNTHTQVKGLAHYLTRQAAFLDCICVANNNFHIMVAGATPPNPAELLSSTIFKEFVEKVRTVYDIIIIDTPPLGALIDPAVVMPLSDGCVFVLEANRINYKFAQTVVGQLKKAGGRILGVVLNKMHSEGMSNYYYYKRYGYHMGRYFKKRGQPNNYSYLNYSNYSGDEHGQKAVDEPKSK